jgi:hypothetical protein
MASSQMFHMSLNFPTTSDGFVSVSLFNLEDEVDMVLLYVGLSMNYSSS